MKRCTKCGLRKDVSKFYKDERSGDKIQSQCKKCQKDYWKRNVGPKKEYDARRYSENRAEIIERVLRYGKTEVGVAIHRKSKAKYKKSDRGIELRRVHEGTDTHKKCKKKRYLIRMYNITMDDFHQMLETQNNQCSICKTDKPGKRGFQVDHDHETGKVRGLLCNKCNKGLGFFVDSVVVLKSAIQYLEVSAGAYDERRN